MSDTHECIDKKELAELRRRAALYGAEKQKLKQWEPPECRFVMGSNGAVMACRGSVFNDFNDFGMAFTSEEQAEEARPLIRSHNRLIRYVQEHGGIQEFKSGCDNWTFNVIDQSSQAWALGRDIGAIWMTQKCAESLAAGLKDGTVIL